MRLTYLAADPGRHGELTETELAELYRHPLPDSRPVYLRSNFVTSLDGSITGSDGRSASVNTPSDQHVFALHRAQADVVLVAAGTARAEGYRAVDLQAWQAEIRQAAGLAAYPTLAVVTNSLDLDPGLATPSAGPGGPVLIVTHRGWSPADLARFTGAGIEVVGVGADRVDLTAAVAALGGRELRRVLCEGGPRLHRDLLAADLVDEMSLTLAPVVVGGDGPRTTAGDPLPRPVGFRPRLVLAADDGTVFTSYRRA